MGKCSRHNEHEKDPRRTFIISQVEDLLVNDVVIVSLFLSKELKGFTIYLTIKERKKKGYKNLGMITTRTFNSLGQIFKYLQNTTNDTMPSIAERIRNRSSRQLQKGAHRQDAQFLVVHPRETISPLTTTNHLSKKARAEPGRELSIK